RFSRDWSSDVCSSDLAFIIPYMFILEPQMLMIDVTLTGVIWILITAITGMIAIGAGLIGFWYRKLYWFERIIAVITGLLLVYPEGNSDIIGLIVFVVMVAIQFMGRNTSKGKMQEAN